MEKLSTKKRLNIAKQYLSGLPYDEIAARSSVSKGTVANVVGELKLGTIPEAADAAEHIELLRELSLDLKRLNLTPGQCAMGLMALTRIRECGLDPADINRWPMLLKAAGNEDEAREFVNLVYSIQEVQKRTGLSIEALYDKVHELEKRAADLEPMSKQHDECEKKIAVLARKRDSLVNEVAGLEQKYSLLSPRVKDLEKREQDLLHRSKGIETKAEEAEAAVATLSKEKQRLQQIGLPFEALAEFSQRAQSIAQHHHIKQADLRARLLQELENLSQAIGLEKLIQERQAELKVQEQDIAKSKQEMATLKASVSSLQQEKMSLAASIKETREIVTTEIAKIIPFARDTINQLREDLKHGVIGASTEVSRLKDEALEVGMELGKYQGMLESSGWLTDIPALIRGEETMAGNRVRTIVLSVLRGTAIWLKHNNQASLRITSMPLTVDNLIGELEQWKV